MLKMKNVDPTMIGEMEKDVNRLNMITDRFSKIGSQPERKEADVVEVTRHALEYLRSRSPKKIKINLTVGKEPLFARINVPLYEWVIENLIRNAIDAIEFLVQNRADYGLELLTDWKENFSVDNKINSEKLFSLYSAPQDTYGSAIPFYSTPLFSIGYNNPFGFGVYCLSYDFYNLFEINDVRRQDGFIYTYTDAFGATITYEPGNENAPNLINPGDLVTFKEISIENYNKSLNE